MSDMRSRLDLDFLGILREYQDREGIHDSELARRLGVNPSQISRLRSESYQSSLTFRNACELLARIGIDVELAWTMKSRSREKISA